MKSLILSTVTSLFIGAAAGATYALLNAPQSGKKTRAQIRKEISGVRSRTKKVITRAQARTMHRLDDIQDRVKEISNAAIEQAERLKKVSLQIAATPRTILEKVK